MVLRVRRDDDPDPDEVDRDKPGPVENGPDDDWELELTSRGV
jgi:hypothetical protein